MEEDKAADQMIFNEELSQVRHHYDNATVLITGGLGFIGRLTVEKILRSCPGVSRLCLLARPKKNKSSQERLDELFKDIIFQKLLLQDPNFRKKVILVNGDLEKENLGISDKDETMLINEVNIVLHLAATVRFDEKLRKAAYINVRAVKDILIMAQKMKNLKSFIHVSTAFSNCFKTEIDEVFYETPITGDNLLSLVNLVDDEYLESLTPSLLKKWPNTYTFTKAIAELTVRKYGKGLPISIVRPSIICATAKEPLVGWSNNYYGVLGICLTTGLGILHTLYADPYNLVDLVPADFTVNAILAASWAVGWAPSKVNQEKVNNVAFDELTVQDNVPIYNYVTSPEGLITVGKFLHVCQAEFAKYPTVHAIWHNSVTLNKYLFVHKIYNIFLHVIPAYIADAILYITGKKPMVVKGLVKLNTLLEVLQYFIKQQWTFKNNNTQTLWKKLGKTDQVVFKFSLSNFDWDSYLSEFVEASRIYLFKDPVNSLEQARKKHFKLKIIHYIIKYLFLIVLVYFSWTILSAGLF